MWFLLALISSLIYSLRSILEKFYIHKTNKYILALAVRLFALPFFLIPLLLHPDLIAGIASLPLSFWLATLYVSLISTPIEMIFFYKALKLSEVTYLVPILALSPLITTIFNFVIFRELPTFYGVLGILIIVSSIYILNIKKASEGFWEPFKHLSSLKAVRSIFVMLLFYSVAIVVDKVAIVGANIYLYAFLNYLFVSLSLFLIAIFKARKYLHQLKTNFKPFFGIGVIVAIYTILRFAALESANSAYVSAILAMSTIFTTIFGLIFLKEKNAKLKMLVALLATVGILIIKLFG